jgi:alkylhydroperoxidase/carboxymuconolactone decarboxylase family protein YurZ
LHRAAELLDPELSPNLPHRELVRDAGSILAQDPLRARLGRFLHGAEARQMSGLCFSLFSLLPGEDDAIALADALPLWAVRVLADTVLLRASAEPLAAIDVVKRFCHNPAKGSILLGLAMAARQADPRHVETALAHASSEADEIREAVLVALRAQQTPRVRELVRRALADIAEPVRLEAMRYCVAYKDTEAATILERRILGPTFVDATPVEVRATSIAYARLGAERAETLLAELATGRRDPTNPELPRLALHGLRAAHTPRARGSLERVAHTMPALAEEAQSLLSTWDRA